MRTFAVASDPLGDPAQRAPPRGALARHIPAGGVLAIVLGVGLALARDFGVANDQWMHINVGRWTVEWVLGESDKLLYKDYRYYGAAFELALLAAERVLTLTDSAEMFLSRYILSHCFFLLGAFACYLLANRLFRSRLLAMFAMLFYLCHPVLHGHSFFNSSDTPFLAMYMIALLLAHSALGGRFHNPSADGPPPAAPEAGSVRAHAVLGAWIGLIATVRPVAFVLLPLVVLARSGQFLRGGSAERWRVAASVAALALSAATAGFAALPYLWGDPAARLLEWFALFTDHPHKPYSWFLGEWIVADSRPWSYLPVWIAVTTPPMVLVLALLGGVALFVRVLRRRLVAGDGFEVLLAASVLLPIAAATFAGSLYSGWRHLYFVYGPTCLLACAGLARLRRRPGRRLATLSVGVAALGLATPLVWIARLHPHQHLYYNFLVDRKTPERLQTQFSFHHWRVPYKEALEFLLRRHPQGLISVGGPIVHSVPALPAAERGRIVEAQDWSAYFLSDPWQAWGAEHSEGAPLLAPVHVRKVFGNTVYAISNLEVDLDAAENHMHKAAYYRALSRPPLHIPPAAPAARRLTRGFRVYFDGRTVTYVGQCTPRDVIRASLRPNISYDRLDPLRVKGKFFLRVFGDRVGSEDRGRYPHNEDFAFAYRGIVFRETVEGLRRARNGPYVCMARADLGGYRVDGLVTGQLSGSGTPMWSARVGFAGSGRIGGAPALLGPEPAPLVVDGEHRHP